MNEPQPHTLLTEDVGTDRAIIVGDPARCDVCAGMLENAKLLNFNREYKTFLGDYKGKKILIMSTGIGAPSAGIGIEELHNVGIKFVIRVGSAGAMQAGIKIGDLIIAEGAVRDDGLSKKYVPEIYPAVPSHKLLTLAKKYAPDAVYGIIRSHDGFYMDDNSATEKFWSEKGIIGADMESGILMVIGRQRGMETLSILNNVVLYEGDLAEGVSDLTNGKTAAAEGEIKSLQVALNILTDDEVK